MPSSPASSATSSRQAAGYAAAHHGDGRWNGVAIVSRAGLDDVRRGLLDQPGFPDPEARALAATCGGLRVWSVYVPNGRTLQAGTSAYKLAWLAALRLDAGRARRPGGRWSAAISTSLRPRRRLRPRGVRGLALM